MTSICFNSSWLFADCLMINNLSFWFVLFVWTGALTFLFSIKITAITSKCLSASLRISRGKTTRFCNCGVLSFLSCFSKLLECPERAVKLSRMDGLESDTIGNRTTTAPQSHHTQSTILAMCSIANSLLNTLHTCTTLAQLNQWRYHPRGQSYSIILNTRQAAATISLKTRSATTSYFKL